MGGILARRPGIGIQQIEQARSAVWDYSIAKNELTNLNLLSWTYNSTTKVGKGYITNVLDVPISGTNIVVATNFVTVKTAEPDRPGQRAGADGDRGHGLAVPDRQRHAPVYQSHRELLWAG